jgi:hypothetical protein
MAIKPSCASCSQPVDRLQRSFGIVAAYPCYHWLTSDQANRVVQHFRELTAAADERVQVD